ncbi:uncharacterized protein LOC106653645 [Trichogramma pretiosum]|uniref:uncharacterized protein LOC106653645 n=1 Tax=Trichogramma pretiosum TaxID=7493 RepID=UPI0006C9DEB6|nr:uncharacterized protein LOC106653645 [Trichogramma pretiosum]
MLGALLETKDARIQTLERQVQMLEAELRRLKDCGGRLREQLARAVPVPSGGSAPQRRHGGLGGGPSMMIRPTSTSPTWPGALRNQHQLALVHQQHAQMLARHDTHFKHQVSVSDLARCGKRRCRGITELHAHVGCVCV